MNKRPLWIVVGGGFLVDQLTKYWAVSSLARPIIVIPERFIFQLVYNYGAAYGIFQHQRLFLLSIGAVVILGAIFFSSHFIQTKWSKWGLSFLLCGAMGNVFDRLRLGYVIDFIDIRIFPVFNIADVCIDIAIGLFIIEMFTRNPSEK